MCALPFASSQQSTSVIGLVVKFSVAIGEPWVRFPDYASLFFTSVIGLVVKFSVAIRVTSGSPGFDSQITHIRGSRALYIFCWTFVFACTMSWGWWLVWGDLLGLHRGLWQGFVEWTLFLSWEACQIIETVETWCAAADMVVDGYTWLSLTDIKSWPSLAQ